MKLLHPNDAQQWYPVNDPVHGFDHIYRVFRLTGYIAKKEGADENICGTAALLHDIRPAGNKFVNDHEKYAVEEAIKILTGLDWPEETIQSVVHCIRSHRWRNPQETPQTLEARVLFDADKLDAIGAMGVARAIAYAARAGAPIYQPPSQEFLLNGKKETGEAHSAWHEYYIKLNRIQQKLFTSTARLLATKRSVAMDAFFTTLVQEADVQDVNCMEL